MPEEICINIYTTKFQGAYPVTCHPIAFHSFFGALKLERVLTVTCRLSRLLLFDKTGCATCVYSRIGIHIILNDEIAEMY